MQLIHNRTDFSKSLQMTPFSLPMHGIIRHDAVEWGILQRCLLCDDALIAIDQDPLVTAPEIQDCGDGVLIFRKALADGTTAIGLFNRSGEKRSCRLDENQRARDLRNGEVCDLCGDFPIAPHGVRIYRTTEASRKNAPDRNAFGNSPAYSEKNVQDTGS